MQSSIFRAYDIRGIVDKTLTEADVFLIGKAFGSLVRDRGETEAIIARDGRLSGPRLAKIMCDGMLSVGCNVIDLGMAPTPVLYFATHYLNQHSGVMVTGSHNPSDYNGLKMVVNGITLSEADIKALYQRILDQQFYTDKLGDYRQHDVTEAYATHIQQDIQLKRPLSIVIDAGNGVAGHIAPALFRALGCQVHELYCDIDGQFPNHHPDPSQPENLQDLIRAVQAHQADVGLAFDGDADRLGVVTSQGNIIWPDRLLMLYAQSILSVHPQAKIIYDVKCTTHLATLIRRLGGDPIIWKTGHSLIKSKMAETQAQLAGEMSGHFFFKDRWFGCDDGMYAGARLVEILSQYTESSDAIFAAIPNSVNTPELKVYVDDEEKFTLMQQLISKANFTDANEIMTIDGLRVNFNDGWGLVRPSNTSPYLIMRFEALNETMLESIKTLFRDWMLSVRPELELPF